MKTTLTSSVIVGEAYTVTIASVGAGGAIQLNGVTLSDGVIPQSNYTFVSSSFVFDSSYSLAVANGGTESRAHLHAGAGTGAGDGARTRGRGARAGHAGAPPGPGGELPRRRTGFQPVRGSTDRTGWKPVLRLLQLGICAWKGSSQASAASRAARSDGNIIRMMMRS